MRHRKDILLECFCMEICSLANLSHRMQVWQAIPFNLKKITITVAVYNLIQINLQHSKYINKSTVINTTKKNTS